jgi:hypothetical protein
LQVLAALWRKRDHRPHLRRQVAHRTSARRHLCSWDENVGEGTNNRSDLAHDLNCGRNTGDLDRQALLRCPSVFLRRTQQCARHADTAGLVWLNHSFRFFGLTYFGACFYRRQTGFYSANRYQLSSKLLASRQVRGLRQRAGRGELGGRGAASKEGWGRS